MLLYGLRKIKSFKNENGFIFFKEISHSEEYFIFDNREHFSNFIKETIISYSCICRNDNLSLFQANYLIENNLLSKNSYIPKIDKGLMVLELLKEKQKRSNNT